ncbi:MAG: hypothetical protein GY799_26160 [Desulfobulbaceae bacterium]|nr:hypothetical protein [Desulfobulbaceae bacterium]
MITVNGKYYEVTSQLLPEYKKCDGCAFGKERPCPVIAELKNMYCTVHPTVIYTEATQEVNEELIKKGAK